MSTATTPRPVVPATQAAKRNWLKEIKTERKSRGGSSVVFGPPGSGKTTLAANGPAPVFITTEDGLSALKSAGLIPPDIPEMPAETWSDTLGILGSLATEKHDYKLAVVDTIGGIENLCHEHVCNRDFDGNWGEKGFASYQKGYEVALPDWREFLNALDKVRDAGMSVMLLAHSLIRPFKNPEGEDYDRYIPDLHHKTWNLTHRWADMVLFLNYYVAVDKKKGEHGKGKGGQRRILYTEYHAAFEAKNRFGLPEEIEMGDSGAEAWGNLKAAIVDAKKGNK